MSGACSGFVLMLGTRRYSKSSARCRSRASSRYPTNVVTATPSQRLDLRLAALRTRIEEVAQAVAEQVDGEDEDEQGDSRVDGEPAGAEDVLPPVREHRSERGVRRLHAEPEIAEARLEEDRDRDV